MTSTYEYTYCQTRLIKSVEGSSECTLYATQEAEVAPFIPPFSYNNMCSSTLVTTFVPVYMFVYCIELLIPVLYLYVFTGTEYEHYSGLLKRSFLHGIFWPEYWNPEGENPAGASASTISMEGSNDNNAEPRKLLKANRIVTSDILSHMLVFFTFGLCSPFLATSILMSVGLKHAMWLMIIGRFVSMRTARQGAGSRARDHALEAFSEACLPVLDLVGNFVWPIVWCSAIFFSFLCWDVLGDEVGWKEAMWAPLLVLAVPVCLWGVTRACCPRSRDEDDIVGDDYSDRHSSRSSVKTRSRRSTKCANISTASDSSSLDSHSLNPLRHDSSLSEMEMRGSSVSYND